MRALIPTLLCTVLLASCGDDPSAAEPFVPIQGAALDGSEDQPEPEPEPEVEPVAVAEPVAEQPPVVAPPAPGPEGPIEVSFWDLSLYELDVDAMLDALLNPEEYDEEEHEELAFPEEIARLDGGEVSIKGYMIPGKMERGNVRDFMLVRDLLGCCFGGAPLPDEWVDVVMHEDADAEYYQYIPVRVTGTFSLGGKQDKAGFARGVYKMQAIQVDEPD
ncbi:MAG: DUF3299 domain-containing protein [Planctomycetota bacterium]|nr:DUF3299 domain-containing protein [Planctomycetota bacterium]